MAFTRIGYGQVEANQLSAQKTGQIYASLPLDTAVDVLQNGEFMFYDYANGTVNNGKEAGSGVYATQGEPMLVFNEIKLYEESFRTTYKDFAMIRVNGTDASGNTVKGENYVTSALAAAAYGENAGGVYAASNTHTEYPYRMDGMAPRLFKTNLGDIMTTNMVDTTGTYALGDLLGLKKSSANTLVLCPAANAESNIDMRWQVVKVYTMPDGQSGLKLQRVQ